MNTNHETWSNSRQTDATGRAKGIPGPALVLNDERKILTATSREPLSVVARVHECAVWIGAVREAVVPVRVVCGQSHIWPSTVDPLLCERILREPQPVLSRPGQPIDKRLLSHVINRDQMARHRAIHSQRRQHGRGLPRHRPQS